MDNGKIRALQEQREDHLEAIGLCQRIMQADIDLGNPESQSIRQVAIGSIKRLQAVNALIDREVSNG